MKIKTAVSVSQFSPSEPNPFVGIVFAKILTSSYIGDNYEKFGINYELMKEVTQEYYDTQTQQMETRTVLTPLYTNNHIITASQYDDFYEEHTPLVSSSEILKENYLHYHILKTMMATNYSLNLNQILEVTE